MANTAIMMGSYAGDMAYFEKEKARRAAFNQAQAQKKLEEVKEVVPKEVASAPIVEENPIKDVEVETAETERSEDNPQSNGKVKKTRKTQRNVQEEEV